MYVYMWVSYVWVCGVFGCLCVYTHCIGCVLCVHVVCVLCVRVNLKINKIIKIDK